MTPSPSCVRAEGIVAFAGFRADAAFEAATSSAFAWAAAKPLKTPSSSTRGKSFMTPFCAPTGRPQSLPDASIDAT